MRGLASPSCTDPSRAGHNGEHLEVFSKVELLLPEIRAAYPPFAASLEKLVDATPDGRKKTAMIREQMKEIRETLAKQQAQTA